MRGGLDIAAMRDLGVQLPGFHVDTLARERSAGSGGHEQFLPACQRWRTRRPQHWSAGLGCRARRGMAWLI